MKDREYGRCLRCGGAGSEWHHRRSRSVRDEHRHCPCNGVLLCKTCHGWAHAHPFDARGSGFIVTRYSAAPGEQHVDAYYGTVLLDCVGNFTPIEQEEG